MKNAKSEKTRIMIFGTFDIVHPGHLHLFQQARALVGKKRQPFLIVSLARDKNVARIKGKKPRNSESKRLKQVSVSEGVDKAVLGAVRNYMLGIIKEQPDIIALGYDQTAYVENLHRDLKKAGLKTKVVRLKSHKPHLYKTSLIKPRKV